MAARYNLKTNFVKQQCDISWHFKEHLKTLDIQVYEHNVKM